MPAKELVIGILEQGTANVSRYSPFDQLYSKYLNVDKFRTLRHDGGLVDAVLVWGGVDIHPNIYKAERHPRNQCASTILPTRDVAELQLMREAYQNGIPIIGVCRGAQLACAFAGGSLFQDISGHHIDHEITTYKNTSFLTTSSHHQMMDLRNVEHELLAWSTSKLSDRYEKAPGEDWSFIPEKEPEIVWFPEIKALAIQGHPEWAGKTGAFIDFVLEEIIERML